MDLVGRLDALGGASRLGDVAPTGAARRRMAGLVASGEVLRTSHGCYHLPGCDPAVVAARTVGGSLTCISAAQVHGLGLLRAPELPHVAVAAARHVRPAGCVLHRERPALLTASPHPALRDGPPVVHVAEALARVLRCQDPITAIVAVDSALNGRRCSTAELASLLVGPGSERARSVLAECDGRSVSVLESVARVVLRRDGLTVEPNVHVPGVGIVDLLVEGRVVVELDGFAHHADRRAFAEDRRRDRELVARGYLPVRFTWEDVVTGPGVVVRAVRAALVVSAPL